MTALLLTAPAAVVHAALQSGRISEYELKAAVLYNLFRFIEWPAASFPSAGSPYVVCVVGADPFGDALPNTFSGKQVDGRGFKISRLDSREPATGCHLAFISAAEERNVGAILKPLESSPALTVADFAEFAASGGMVTLFTESARVRFSINEAEARRVGLRISSLLLSLARPPVRVEK